VGAVEELPEQIMFLLETGEDLAKEVPEVMTHHHQHLEEVHLRGTNKGEMASPSSSVEGRLFAVSFSPFVLRFSRVSL